MNYTKNLKLPQWSTSDRVRMEDFNAAMASIDAGYTASPGSLPYVIGSYVSDGDLQFVFLDFEPSFVIISGVQQTKDMNSGASLSNYFVATANNPELRSRVELTTYGFCTYPAGNNGTYLPNLCEKDRQYFYIAFK